MNKLLLIIYLLMGPISDNTVISKKYITRQGQVTFFSYTNVENIEAKNNGVLSIIDWSKNEIAISMLMNAFVFKKALMREHFNESYIESDLYPKATFEGSFVDFEPIDIGVRTKIIKGKLTLRGITKEVTVKTTIENNGEKYFLNGDFEVAVKDFEINIPPLLAPNIAKTISIKFKFEYEPYEI